MKRLSLFLALVIPAISFGQQASTYKFADRSDESLYMDVYQPSNELSRSQCVLFVFGGGFKSGSRDSKSTVAFMQELTKKGYTAIAIDYRLALKDVSKRGLSLIKSIEEAINVATEDLFSAAKYIIDNADMLRVDTSDIVLVGSSAGAITILQADYELNNRFEMAKDIPNDFHFGGIIPFSGAIFSREGKIKYREHSPAPTFFFHGTSDRLVTYNQIKFFNIGFFGANSLVKRFEKNDYPYYAIRFEGIGHDVASYMSKYVDEIEWFIDNYVDGNRNLQIDVTYNDPTTHDNNAKAYKPNNLYNDK